jgi:hypothetical protein
MHRCKNTPSQDELEQLCVELSEMPPDHRLLAASVLELLAVDGAKKKRLHDLEAVEIGPLKSLRGQR